MSRIRIRCRSTPPHLLMFLCRKCMISVEPVKSHCVLLPSSRRNRPKCIISRKALESRCLQSSVWRFRPVRRSRESSHARFRRQNSPRKSSSKSSMKSCVVSSSNSKPKWSSNREQLQLAVTSSRLQHEAYMTGSTKPCKTTPLISFKSFSSSTML